MVNVAARLDRALRAAGHPIIGVSIGRRDDRATWRVHPAELQEQAQPAIDAFNENDPAHEAAELDAQVTARLDTERIFSALVWAIIDTYSPPATVTKYTAARTKIINAYRTKPWAP